MTEMNWKSRLGVTAGLVLAAGCGNKAPDPHLTDPAQVAQSMGVKFTPDGNPNQVVFSFESYEGGRKVDVPVTVEDITSGRWATHNVKLKETTAVPQPTGRR